MTYKQQECESDSPKHFYLFSFFQKEKLNSFMPRPSTFNMCVAFFTWHVLKLKMKFIVSKSKSLKLLFFLWISITTWTISCCFVRRIRWRHHFVVRGCEGNSEEMEWQNHRICGGVHNIGTHNSQEFMWSLVGDGGRLQSVKDPNIFRCCP